MGEARSHTRQMIASLLVAIAIVAAVIIAVTARLGPTPIAELDAREERLEAQEERQEEAAEAREERLEGERLSRSHRREHCGLTAGWPGPSGSIELAWERGLRLSSESRRTSGRRACATTLRAGRALSGRAARAAPARPRARHPVHGA